MPLFVLPGIYVTCKALALIQLGILALQVAIVTYMSVDKIKKVEGFRSDDHPVGMGISPGLYTYLLYNRTKSDSKTKGRRWALNAKNYFKQNRGDRCIPYGRTIDVCVNVYSLQFKIADFYKTDDLLCLKNDCRFEITYSLPSKNNTIFQDSHTFHRLTGLLTTFQTHHQIVRVMKLSPGKVTAWYHPVLLNLKGQVYFKNREKEIDYVRRGFEIEVYYLQGDGEVAAFQGTY